MEILTTLAFIVLIVTIITIIVGMFATGPSSFESLVTELKMKDESNPKTPIQSLNEKVNTTSRTIIYDNKYIQRQIKKGDKWVLHSINGPAVYDLETKESFFFVDGVQYEEELRYLVAKETYENINGERGL